MIIKTKLFWLFVGRRVDLSGRPFGVRLMWLPGLPSKRFEPVPCARDLGFHLAWLQRADPNAFLTNQYVEVPCGHAMSTWPQKWREAADAAVERLLEAKRAEHGKPFTVVERKSFCDRRHDLSGSPYQLLQEFTIAEAA